MMMIMPHLVILFFLLPTYLPHPTNNIHVASPPTSDTDSIYNHVVESIPLIEQPLRKSSRVSKPVAYLQDFRCSDVTTNISYPLSNYISYRNLASSHFSYISTITVNQEPCNYK